MEQKLNLMCRTSEFFHTANCINNNRQLKNFSYIRFKSGFSQGGRYCPLGDFLEGQGAIISTKIY